MAAWPLIFYWRAAFGTGVFFFGDIARFFYPTRVLYANALHAGRLPLWQPEILLGFPLFAEMQTGALYPPHLVLYSLLPVDLALNYDILLHLAWLAAGTFLFARGRGLSPGPAALAALAFSAGGFGVGRVTHMSVLAVAAWLPWSLHVYDHWRRDPGVRVWLLLALIWGLQFLAGHPQFMFLNVLTFGAYALGAAAGWLASPEEGSSEGGGGTSASRARRAAVALLPVLTVLLGAGLAAVQLLPTAEMAQASARAGGVTEAFFTEFSFNPFFLGLWIDPFILGNPYPRVSVEIIAYFGALPLLLAIAGVWLQRANRATWFWLALAAGCFFLALGGFNPFYRGLRLLPVLNFFRVPARFLFPLSLAVSMLAASGLQALVERTTPAAFIRRSALAAAGFALAVALVIVFTPRLGIEGWIQLWRILPFAFWGLAIAIVAAAWRRRTSRESLVVIAVGLTLVDLAAFAAVYAQTFNAVEAASQVLLTPRVLPSLQLADGARIRTSEWMFPWVPEMRESLYPNLNAAFGVQSVHGYSPLISGRMQAVLANMSPRLLNLLGVRYYLVPQVLPVDAQSEGSDLNDPYMIHPVGQTLEFTETEAKALEIESSLAQSANLKDGEVVADIRLFTRDGRTISLPLRAGSDTAEWAYERPDVRETVQHSEPPIASTFAARSAFPVQEHAGHTFRAVLSVGESPVQVTGIRVEPRIAAGLLYIQKLVLTDGSSRVDVAALVGKSSHRLVYRSEDVAVFENPDYAPRAWLTHNAVRVASDEEALARLEDPQYAGELLLADGEPTGTDMGQMIGEQASLVRYEPERVVIDVRARTGGYLVLADAWDAGWTATVDGQRVPIDRADVVLRAVPVNAGDHRVEFTYRPYSFYAGIVGSLISVAVSGIIAAAVWLWRRRAAINGRTRAPVI